MLNKVIKRKLSSWLAKFCQTFGPFGDWQSYIKETLAIHSDWSCYRYRAVCLIDTDGDVTLVFRRLKSPENGVSVSHIAQNSNKESIKLPCYWYYLCERNSSVNGGLPPPKASDKKSISMSLRWRHNGCDSVSNHQPHHCLLNRLFRRRSKKTSKLRVTDLCAGNSPGTGEFSAQMASNAENVSIWWRHHVIMIQDWMELVIVYTLSYWTGT